MKTKAILLAAVLPIMAVAGDCRPETWGGIQLFHGQFVEPVTIRMLELPSSRRLRAKARTKSRSRSHPLGSTGSCMIMGSRQKSVKPGLSGKCRTIRRHVSDLVRSYGIRGCWDMFR